MDVNFKKWGYKQNKSNFGSFFGIINWFKYILKETTRHWNFKTVTQLTQQKQLTFKSGAEIGTKSYIHYGWLV